MVERKKQIIKITLTALLLFSLCPLFQAVAGEKTAVANYEMAPVLVTTELVEGIELENRLYTIDPKVLSDGFLLEFTVKSDFGTFYPKSPALLSTTLVEIAALEELDKVSNSDVFLDGLERSGKEIGKEIKSIKNIIGKNVLKVILETCYLTKEEIKIACQLAVDAGADFVKTSTGFGTNGATFEDVELMKSVVKDKAQIKASGGVRDLETATKYIEMGVTRLGTSSGVGLMTTGKAVEGQY